MTGNIYEIVNRIITEYGDAAFNNMSRANAVLLDLAPGMTRERVLIRDFIEIGGYGELKRAGGEYEIVRRKLTRGMTETYCLEPGAAEWVVRLFGTVLGYDNLSDGAAARYNAQTPAAAQTVLRPPEQFNINRNALIGIGKAHVVAVAADGTVFAGGDNSRFQCDVGAWRGVVAVAAGDAHTVGLRADGTVLAAGLNNYDQCDVGGVTNAVAVYAHGNDTACILADGTVKVIGYSMPDVSHFRDIKYIARFPEGLFGVRADGTVDVALNTGDAAIDSAYDNIGENAATGDEIRWARSLTNVSAIISTYINGSIVLKTNGRIYKMNQPDAYFAQWREVISIADLSDYFAVLREDGTVRVLTYDRNHPRKATDADNWRGVTAIYGKYKRLIGLTRDGTLLALCTDPDWQKRNGNLDFVKNWYPIML